MCYTPSIWVPLELLYSCTDSLYNIFISTLSFIAHLHFFLFVRYVPFIPSYYRHSCGCCLTDCECIYQACCHAVDQSVECLLMLTFFLHVLLQALNGHCAFYFEYFRVLRVWIMLPLPLLHVSSRQLYRRTSRCYVQVLLPLLSNYTHMSEAFNFI